MFLNKDIFFFCRNSLSSQANHLTTDDNNVDESWSDDNVSIDDYSTSDEETDGSSLKQQDDESINSQETLTSDDDCSTSSEDEDIISSGSIDTSTDSTILRIRSLIKRVRDLVTLVHQSGTLSEYFRDQAKAKKLPGEVRIENIQQNAVIIIQYHICVYT